MVRRKVETEPTRARQRVYRREEATTTASSARAMKTAEENASGRFFTVAFCLIAALTAIRFFCPAAQERPTLQPPARTLATTDGVVYTITGHGSHADPNAPQVDPDDLETSVVLVEGEDPDTRYIGNTTETQEPDDSRAELAETSANVPSESGHTLLDDEEPEFKWESQEELVWYSRTDIAEVEEMVDAFKKGFDAKSPSEDELPSLTPAAPSSALEQGTTQPLGNSVQFFGTTSNETQEDRTASAEQDGAAFRRAARRRNQVPVDQIRPDVIIQTSGGARATGGSTNAASIGTATIRI